MKLIDFGVRKAKDETYWEESTRNRNKTTVNTKVTKE